MTTTFEHQAAASTAAEDTTTMLAASPCFAGLRNDRPVESETEDEEVKMNCIGGFRGVEDSDMNTTDNSDSEDDLADNEDDQPTKESHVVNFVKERRTSGLPLVRPVAITTPPRKRLSPHEEEGASGSDSSSSAGSSVGARGVGFNTETPAAFSDVSEDEGGVDADDDMSEDEEADALNETGESGSDGELSEEELEEENFVSDADEELSGIMETLDREVDQSEADDSEALGSYIGVMEDRDVLVTIPKPKRVLSFNTLAALNAAAGHGMDSPKRLKSSPEIEFEQPHSLPTFTLGPAAALDVMSTQTMLRPRMASPIISSGDEEELDRQLGEELDDHQSDDDGSRENSTPVPLLTPPQSPLTVEIDGATTTVCEWPSNLAVDSAMASAMNLQPLSPEAFLAFKEESDERVTSLRKSKPVEASTLTPLLRGISVGK